MNYRISQRAASLSPSLTLAIDAKAKQMKADGLDVVGFGAGEPEMVKLAGAKPVILQTTDKSEFKVTPGQLRAAITPRTRLFVFNSPSNPTGSVYTPDETRALGEVCIEKDVLIMSDEIYEHL